MKLSSLMVAAGILGTFSFFQGTGDMPFSELVTRIFSKESAPSKTEWGPELISINLPENGAFPRSLLVARFEVSVADWQDCVIAKACPFKPKEYPYTKADHPVSGVSWNDVQYYLRWINSVTGESYRLPRASEWRVIAADVLDKEVEKLFDDPRLAWAADYANFGKRAERRTQSTGHFGTVGTGIADIAGNVWEWTDTCWRSADATGVHEATDDCGGVRVLAGAHMTYQSELIRLVPTGGCSIGFPPANIGFRLVLDQPETAQS